MAKPTKKQSQNFIDAARELGADEDPRTFDRALKKLADAKPSNSPRNSAKNSVKGKGE
ncbi:MAG: hypothetical protein AAF709_18955 [Pseudomonadota bacterium]